jgi:hypothetical protein
VLALDRNAIRRRFEERFSSIRMTKDYLKVYRSIVRKTPHRDVDVPALAAGAAAHASSLDLVKDTVILGHELCTDRV